MKIPKINTSIARKAIITTMPVEMLLSVKKQHRSQSSEEIFDKVKEQIGNFLALIEVFISHDYNGTNLRERSQVPIGGRRRVCGA